METTGQLIILRLVQGVALSGISAPIFALAADKSKAGSAGTQMSVITMSFGLGLAFGPVLAGFMAGYLSFESPFLLAGAACFLMTFFIGRYVEETVHRNNEKPIKEHWKSDGNTRMKSTGEPKSENAESVE
ncbi:MAG: MFS transporter [Calditrichota bacterium]